MICRRSISYFLFLPLLLAFSIFSTAQTALPDLQATSQKGINVLSWLCQYEGIKSIAVQRSHDSIYNYTTIGYVKDTKKGVQGYVDGHPLPGNNFYRLYIAFNSDLTWYSNRIKIYIDSSQLMQKAVLPPNDSLQKMLNTSLTDGENSINTSAITSYTYTRSQYIFTNPFTGHINIELPDDMNPKDVYSIKFFNQENVQIFEVPKVSEQSVILDKRNFQRKGLYKFELLKNAKLLESGFVTIY